MRLSSHLERQVADLYYSRELRTTEIAEQFGIARQTVPQIARRVRAKQKEAPASTKGYGDSINNPETPGRDPSQDTPGVSPDLP